MLQVDLFTQWLPEGPGVFGGFEACSLCNPAVFSATGSGDRPKTSMK
jgi:hypothetical protein